MMSKRKNFGMLLMAGVFLLFCSLVFQSCTSRKIYSDLEKVESFIQDRPDSALTILKEVNRDLLTTDKLRAKFSLLYSTALNKNYIDTVDMSIIQPAVDFYSKHGTPVEKMKAYFYKGCFHLNRGEDDRAMYYYQLALEDTLKVTDNHYKELVNSAISDIFSRNNNAEQELVYTIDALKYGRLAKDSIGVWAITGHLASCYANCRRWEDAKRTYEEFFAMPVYDSTSYGFRCVSYAKDLLRFPEPKPHKSIETINEVINTYPTAITIEAYCIYAYAHQMIDEDSIANNILKQLENLNKRQDLVKLWRYRVLRDQGKYKQALEDLEESVLVQDSIVLSSLNQSLIKAQRDYLSVETKVLRHEHELDRQRMVILVLSTSVIIGILILQYLRKKRELDKRIEELACLYYESQQMINLQNIQNTAMNAQLADKDAALFQLRKQFASLYKAQYKILNDLCYAYLSPIKKSRKHVLYYEAMRQLDIIVNDNESQNKFMLLVNNSLDNIIDKLRRDLPEHKEKDFRFLVYVIVGFDATTISNLTGYSIGTVYTKKNRLKGEISRLSSEYRNFYLEFIN